MTIKAGDLVMVVRGRLCCGYSRRLGTVFTVQSVCLVNAVCDRCGTAAENEVAFMNIKGEHGLPYFAELSRLIRIDPPAEPVSVFDRVEEPA